MTPVAIIQARMGSSRLPGKQVMDIAGKPLIWHVVTRVLRSTKLRGAIVAIPAERESHEIVKALDNLVHITIYRGDPSDLIGRYNTIAEAFDIDTIVRIPGDNPCVDPQEIDRIIDCYEKLPKPVGQWLTTNLDKDVLGNGYPGGLGAEVYDRWFMHWMHTNVDDAELREHPHKWAIQQDRVHTVPAPHPIKRPDLKLSVDTLGDLEFVRSIYDGLYEGNPEFGGKDIMKFLDQRALM